MIVHVEYAGQPRLCAGCASETVELEAGAGLESMLATLADRHGDAMRRLLLGADGRAARSLLCFAGDKQVDWANPPALREGARVTLLSPMSGG